MINFYINTYIEIICWRKISSCNFWLQIWQKICYEFFFRHCPRSHADQRNFNEIFLIRYVKTSFVKFVPRPPFHQWPPGGALAVNCVNKSSFHGQFLGTRPKSNAILVFKAISNFVNFWDRPNIWVWIWLFLMDFISNLESIDWYRDS